MMRALGLGFRDGGLRDLDHGLLIGALSQPCSCFGRSL